MHIEVFDDFETFDRIRPNWIAVYEADPEAQYMVSWSWLKTYFRDIRPRWFVAALKPAPDAADYVGFFPLQLRTEDDNEGTFWNEIRMGGAEFSDYRGFICRPEYQDQAIQAFADYLRNLNWRQLRLHNLRLSEKRWRGLMKPYGRGQFVIEESENIDDVDGTNHNICPYAEIGPTWDKYLEKLSANTRQKARRFLKKVDEGKEFRVTHAKEKHEVERDLETLLKFWRIKWEPRKGDRIHNIMGNNRMMLMGRWRAGELLMPVLWQGERPLVVFGSMLDKRKKTIQFLITGRDETFNSPPPGFILHAHTIRWAIQNGYEIYDFLQGNEPYKYMFATGEKRLKSFTIKTKNNENLGGVLDRRCLDDVLHEATELHKKGKLQEAARAYKQIIATDPHHTGALYLYAQLEVVRTNHAAAEKLFRSYIELKPANPDAWFRLGQTQQAQADIDGAVKSYRKVLELEPSNTKVPPILLELKGPSALPAHTRGAPKLDLDALLRAK